MQIIPAPDQELTALLTTQPPGNRTAICWLGQAGFLLIGGGKRILIDPYLSDSLAKKYAGTPFPHRRMMPPPVAPDQLSHIDLVLCTHAHTDHMDPETLLPLALQNRHCQFVVPLSARHTAVERGVPVDRLLALDGGQQVCLANISLLAVPSAHEDIQVDEQGHHRFLGYVLSYDGCTVYHSGDCVPYPELADTLKNLSVELALLPVNGRDELRRRRGVPGNFTLAEAAALCEDSGIPAMIPCHFGMFDFNTVDVSWLDRQIADLTSSLSCVRLAAGRVYWLEQLSPPPHTSGACL